MASLQFLSALVSPPHYLNRLLTLQSLPSPISYICTQALFQWQIQLLLQIVLRDSKRMPNGTMLSFPCTCFPLASNIAAGSLGVVLESDFLLYTLMSPHVAPSSLLLPHSPNEMAGECPPPRAWKPESAGAFCLEVVRSAMHSSICLFNVQCQA